MRTRFRLLQFAIAALVAATSHAQVTRPEGSSRVVRTWDFEPVQGVLVPVPEHWFRGHSTDDAPRAGFPPWNEAVLQEDAGIGGSWALRIPTKGGSTSLTLARGVIPVFGDADYALIASVKTSELKLAGVVISARLIDGELNPIPGTEVRSRDLRTDDTWENVHLEIRGAVNAESLQIELMVLQPEDHPGFRRNKFQAMEQDLDGAAWIDNIVVYQTPRIDLQLSGIGNLVIEPETPALSMSVRDLAGEPLTIETTIFDYTGAVAVHDERPATSGGQMMNWTPDLRRFGWYRAVMEVRNDIGLIGRSYRDFVWLPQADDRRAEFATRPADRHGFAVTLSERPEGEPISGINEHRYMLPALLSELHTGSIAIPAWTNDGAEIDRDFALMTESLLEDGHDVSFILDHLPRPVASDYRVDQNNLFVVLENEDNRWVRSIEQILSRFGERSQTWQIGAEGSSDPFYIRDIRKIVQSVSASITGMVPKPVIRLPWRTEQPDDGLTGADEFSLTLPSSVRSSSIEQYASGWANPNTSLLIELPMLDTFSPRDRIIELIRRITIARANGAKRISIHAPWSEHTYAGRSGQRESGVGDIMPSPEFAAMRLLSDALSNRTIVGELKEIGGVRVFIAQGKKSSMLIAWREHADPSDAKVSGYLGDQRITVRDPFGNATESIASNGEHSIPLTETPVYIEGIDVELAKFRAGLRIEPHFIQSEARRHYVELAIDNPWNSTISGRIRFKEPKEWKLTPKVLNFRLGPGETERYDLSLVLGGAEEAGPRRILAEVELVAMREYPIFEVPMQVEIGLDAITLRVSYRYENDETGKPAHIIITAVVTNLSDQPATLRSVVVAPGQASQQRSISGLVSGEAAIRTFRLENAVEALKGKTIRVGLREQNGPGRLNRSLQMPE